MTLLERLRLLQAPADGGAGASSSGGTSATDAGAGKGQDAGAAGAAAGGKDGAPAAGTGEKRSMLKAGGTGATGDGSGGANTGKTTDGDGAKAKANDGADEPYDVKIPEGVKVDEAELKAWTTTAKELGLSAEVASKLIGWNDQRVKAATDGQVKAWAKQGDDWYGALEKDPEFGGQNLQASTAALQTALTRFDPKGELVADLEKYGIDNLPSLAKFLRRVGLAGAEDKVVVRKAPETKQQSGDEARRAKRYPSIKGIQGG